MTKITIPEFPDFSVDENGVFYNDATGHILKLSKMASDSVKVNFRVGTRVYSRSAARMVCLMFHGEPRHIRYVPNYIDGNILNISASNLEWQTRWYVAEYQKQLRRTKPLINTPIVRIEFGDVYPDSITASHETGILEKWIALAVMQKQWFGGSHWDYADNFESPTWDFARNLKM